MFQQNVFLRKRFCLNKELRHIINFVHLWPDRHLKDGLSSFKHHFKEVILEKLWFLQLNDREFTLLIDLHFKHLHSGAIILSADNENSGVFLIDGTVFGFCLELLFGYD